MDFGQAVSSGFKNFTNFTDRASRSEYWYFWLFAIIVNLAQSALFGDGIISVLVSLALIVPMVSVGVRRLHDTNRTGWWMLVSIIPLAGLIMAIFWLTKVGTIGPNQYGYDPLEGRHDENRNASGRTSGDDDMFQGRTRRNESSRDDNQRHETQSHEAQRHEPDRHETGRHETRGSDRSRDEKASESLPEGPWADRKSDTPKQSEPQKQIEEEKRRKIEPPRFGRDAGKRDK